MLMSEPWKPEYRILTWTWSGGGGGRVESTTLTTEGSPKEVNITLRIGVDMVSSGCRVSVCDKMRWLVGWRLHFLLSGRLGACDLC